MESYKGRIIDKTVEEKLAYSGAILIQGAKWCGKTTTAEHFAKSKLYMNDPDEIKNNLQLAKIKPTVLLQGESPRLIDEWQIAPTLWDAIRFEVDHRDGFGFFILTGSAVPADLSEVNHTGTGRINRVTMRPMSLYESNDSSGEISLAKLFNGEDEIFAENHLGIEDIAYLVCRGGWPEVTKLQKKYALKPAIDYYEGLINSDINRADGEAKNIDRTRLIMRSLARNQGAQIANTKIASEISANEKSKISDDSVAKYINALKNIFAEEDMTAWNPNLRSKTVIRTADTRYFVDPSIATSALGIGPKDLLRDLNTFGFLFETICVRDLRVYGESLGGNVYHYRDKNGLECDAVIHLRNGKYGLIEIKLGGEDNIEEGCKSLKKLEKIIDFNKMPTPSFKMVLIGAGKYAYKRQDGILIVPIGCLKN